MNELLDNPAYAAELARNGLAFSRERFDWDRITDDIENVYHDAIGTRHVHAPARRAIRTRSARHYSEA